jgi:hypothetical protein
VTSNTDFSLSCQTAEVRYLHRHFFRSDPPPEVIERYIAANRLCLPTLDESSLRILSTVVSQQLDPEAVEIVLRHRHLNPVLTRKIQILFYLVEVRSSYYTYFVSNQAGFTRASLQLLTSVIQTAWKLAKGTYLIRRYGLV